MGATQIRRVAARSMAACLLAALVQGIGSCSTANVGAQRGVSATQNFVGRLLPRGASNTGSETPLLAFIVAPKEDGSLDVRVYMCDGVEDGDLLWARGPALAAPKSGAAFGSEPFVFDLTSGSGFQVQGSIGPGGISGTVARKQTSAVSTDPVEFVAARAPEGSGIFDMTVDDQGNLTGKSLTGDSLDLEKSLTTLRANGDGTVFAGLLQTVDGATMEVEQVDLSTLGSEDLQGEGFDSALAAGERGLQVGTFRAIVLLDGGHLTSFGRLLLPGTGVNNVPPQFGPKRIALSTRVIRGGF